MQKKLLIISLVIISLIFVGCKKLVKEEMVSAPELRSSAESSEPAEINSSTGDIQSEVDLYFQILASRDKSKCLQLKSEDLLKQCEDMIIKLLTGR